MIPFVRSDTAGGAHHTVQAPAPMAESLRVSVVIPSGRRPDLLCRCLAAVFAQEIGACAFEVIVVDDHDGEDMQAVVEAFRHRPGAPAVRLVQPRQGHGPAVARNAGWRAAFGRIVAFTTPDAVPSPDWLSRGERALRPEWVAVSGRIVSTLAPRPPGTRLDPARSARHDGAAQGGHAWHRQGPPPRDPASGGLADSRRDPGLRRDPTSGTSPVLSVGGFATANAFVRRSALLALGGFDERFRTTGNADSDLLARLLRDAGPVGRSDDAVVLKRTRPPRWRGSLRQQQDGFFDALLHKKHPHLSRQLAGSSPPWGHYAIVALTLAAALLWLADVHGSALVSLALAGAGMLRLALRRLRHRATRGRPLEALLTSVVIPYLSVYWRLRGAIHFRVLFL